MRRDTTGMAVDSAVLNEVLTLAGDDLSVQLRASSARVLERIYARDSLDPLTIVAAFVGATGSGKSSLFNAVMGQELARTDVVRPTTRVGLAAVPREMVEGARGETGAHELLNWLGVEQGVSMPDSAVLGASTVLIDVPDIDSVDRANGELAARLASRVDLLVWVVDPQKYADDVIHSQWIRPMASRAQATLVVLNQVDRLEVVERQTVVESLRRLLVEDGIENPRILLTSAVSGEGVKELGEQINSLAFGLRQYAVNRDAALRDLRDAVHTELGIEQWDPGVSVSSVSATIADGIADSAPVQGVVDTVQRAYRHRRISACGWLPFQLLRRFRPDPLGRLHLTGGGSDSVSDVDLEGLMGPSGVSVLLHHAARQFAQGRPERWGLRLGDIVRSQSQSLTQEIQLGIARTDLSLGRQPRWWSVMNVFQAILWLCALVGVGWLGLTYAARTYLFVPIELPMWGHFPVPTVLLLGGTAGTVFISFTAAVMGIIGARRHGLLARRALRRSVAEVVEAHLFVPLQTEDARQREIVDKLLR